MLSTFLEYLLRYKANPRALSASWISPAFAIGPNMTPLEVAVRFGHTNIVEFFLKLGENANIIDNAGVTPIHSAARDGNKEMVKILLRYKANPRALSASWIPPAFAIGPNMTPLQVAARFGYEDIVKVLNEALHITTLLDEDYSHPSASYASHTQ
jgi:ankyrin repeat protein